METGQKIQEIFAWQPAVPHDEVELRHIIILMDKVPAYLEKLKELTAQVEKFSQIAQPLTFNAHCVIDQMIFHAFFSDLENRKFKDFTDEDIHRHMSHVRAQLQLEGIINSRNLSCEVCGENRSTDRCHIIPSKLGGSGGPDNILILCPTHHRLFDRFMLSRGEYASIRWESKSEPSQHYATSVTLTAHMKHLDSVAMGEYRRIPQFDREFIPFVKHVLLQILNIFIEKRVLKRANIFMVLDPNVHGLATTIISFLLKKGILKREKRSTGEYFFPADLDPEAIDKTAFEIWQASF